jgi:hypothetical protein
MKKLPPDLPEQPGHGTQEMLRAVIADALGGTAVHADHAADHALNGDIRLLQLNIRHATSYMKTAIQTLQDLNELIAKRASND